MSKGHGLAVYLADGVTLRKPLHHRTSLAEFERRPTLQEKARYLEHFFLFRKQALLDVGGVDEDIGLVGPDDYDLIWTLLEWGRSVDVVEDRLYNYREHGGERLTLRPLELQQVDLEKILNKHGVTGAEGRRLLRAQRQAYAERLRTFGLNAS